MQQNCLKVCTLRIIEQYQLSHDSSSTHYYLGVPEVYNISYRGAVILPP